MKKFVPLLSLFWFWATLFSQTPQSVPYQAVARDASGNLMQNQGISLRFTIHDATAGGTILYQETQAATTNKLGLFNVNVGLGTVVTGTFNSVAWGNNNAKYMQVELDPNGGANYTTMGTSQMMSVPYALYAANAGAVAGTEPTITAGNTAQYWRGDKTWQTLNTSVVPEGTNLYYTNARGIGSTLTGYTSTTGAITSADNILTAIEKLNGNVGAIVSGVSSVNGNTGSVPLTGSSSISISGADVFSINPTYPGQSSITTLGTVGTGTWNGSVISPTYGGTGINNGTNTLTIPASGTAAEGTGTADYAAYWSGTNTLSAEQYLNVNRGGMGANMTTTTGAIPYATATNAYGTLGIGTSGYFLTSTGSAPAWTAASSTTLGFNSWTKVTTASTPAIISNNQYVTGYVGIGSTTNGDGTYNFAASGYSPVAPLTVVYPTAATASSTPVATALRLASPGTSGTKWPVVADFQIGSYGTSGSPAQTQLNLKMSNGNVGSPDVTVMTALGNGNIGLGTTTPGYQLTLAGAGAVTAFAVDNGNTFAAKNYNSTASSEVYENYLWPRWTDNVMYINYGSAGFNVRNDASTSTMFMNSSNQVGIGTITPGAALEISRGSNASQLTGTTADVVIQARNAGSGDARLAFVSNDNVGNSGAGIIDGWANSYGGGAAKAVEISFPTSQGGASGEVNGNIAFSVNKGTTSTLTEVMRVASNGFVGIGTPSPGDPLQVSGSANSSGNYYYYCGSGCSNGTSSGAYPLSIVASNGIQCTQLNIPSDMRIKNIIGYSNGAEDLQTLEKIRITNYKMRDEAVYGEKINKKVIAQQVKEVYPLAVQNAGGTQYLPNIYLAARSYNANGSILSIELPKPVVADKDIKIGSACKLYMYGFDGIQYEVNTKIVELQDNTLKVKTNDSLESAKYNGNVFVYGTEVNDFLAVDYDAISMLNVSATQELARKVAVLEKQNTALTNANQKLDEQNCGLAQKVDALSSVSNEVQLLHQQMDALKALMEKNGIRTER